MHVVPPQRISMMHLAGHQLLIRVAAEVARPWWALTVWLDLMLSCGPSIGAGSLLESCSYSCLMGYVGGAARKLGKVKIGMLM